MVWHPSLVSTEEREALNGHRAAVVWFTGLPGSGKSTTAHGVERELLFTDCQALVLDGDNIRHGLSSDLGFSPADRGEHLRRVAELAKLMYSAGTIVLCAFVSPTRQSRDKVRSMVPAGTFFEIYCKCSAAVCAKRDQKGFYASAQAGKLLEYTGVSASYEEPITPELVLDTAAQPPDHCVKAIIELLRKHGVIGSPGDYSAATDA